MADRERFRSTAVILTSGDIDTGDPTQLILTFNTAITGHSGEVIDGSADTDGGPEAPSATTVTGTFTVVVQFSDPCTNNGDFTMSFISGITFAGGATCSVPQSVTMHA